MVCPYFLFFTSQKTREPRATCKSQSKSANSPDFIQAAVEKKIENYIESRMDRDYNSARGGLPACFGRFTLRSERSEHCESNP